MTQMHHKKLASRILQALSHSLGPPIHRGQNNQKNIVRLQKKRGLVYSGNFCHLTLIHQIYSLGTTNQSINQWIQSNPVQSSPVQSSPIQFNSIQSNHILWRESDEILDLMLTFGRAWEQKTSSDLRSKQKLLWLHAIILDTEFWNFWIIKKNPPMVADLWDPTFQFGWCSKTVSTCKFALVPACLRSGLPGLTIDSYRNLQVFNEKKKQKINYQGNFLWLSSLFRRQFRHFHGSFELPVNFFSLILSNHCDGVLARRVTAELYLWCLSICYIIVSRKPPISWKSSNTPHLESSQSKVIQKVGGASTAPHRWKAPSENWPTPQAGKLWIGKKTIRTW